MTSDIKTVGLIISPFQVQAWGIRFCCLSTNFQELVYFKDKEYALLYFWAVASCFDKKCNWSSLRF